MSDPHTYPTRAAAMEAADDEPLSPVAGDTIGDVIARRYSRRDIMKGALGVTAATALFGPAALAASKAEAASVGDRFSFDEVAAGANEYHHVAEGYDAKVLLSWGDPVCADVQDKPFDPRTLTAEEQEYRFGYNNDYIAYFPIDGSSEHGLLCINHEYTNEELMFPGLGRDQSDSNFRETTKEIANIEMAAVGVTVVEVRKVNDKWEVVHGDRNRRITLNTEMTIDGDAAGTARMKTREDSTGKRVFGTFSNCAGGKTPWGTYLTAEENIHGGFWTEELDANFKPDVDHDGKYKASYKRYRIPTRWQSWGKYHKRFNFDEEENEPNRFGWIVEIDPEERESVPVKHTALGRFFHEGAETTLSNDGRAVVFSGDDAQNEYVYRFVSRDHYIKGNKAHNATLLEHGTLSVAQFSSEGTGKWIPLKYGEGKLAKACSAGKFENQADVLIDARLAADEVGATKMDRPEDVQPNEETRRVYVMLTNNTKRNAGTVDAANPRPNNKFGHIIEMIPDGGDFGADTFTWNILVRCGDPTKMELGAYWNAATTEDSWFVSPDNATVDPEGRLWIATDQGKYWQQTGRADGLFALETEGIRRGTPRMFFRVPMGAELCGPCFTPDGKTLFLSVQHPGADGVDGYANFKGPSVFENPATRWPDFDPKMPPRPSVMVITHPDGKEIG
ncbi:PhoX family phosphatase [Methyloceanibacter sp. wino2]|uniref:PhoX family protein n=1 Tax=Methyloceanibacter sp. wino2 TaxID=2170729 RepID=UPI000D3E8751|nr:PhoX family phosphatase [Methyloceanibacter sp. wino2]